MSIEKHIEDQRALEVITHRPCKICYSASRLLDSVDLNKTCGPADSFFEHKRSGVNIFYRKCSNCGFVFTEFFDNFTPELWRKYIYNDDYYEKIDPDYKHLRPMNDSNQLDCLLRSPRDGWVALDYGGGSGLMSRLMAEKGYNYDSYDPFGEGNTVKSENIGRYNFCSLFEVAEHTTSPIVLLSDVLRFLNNDRFLILVGTQVQNDSIVSKRLDNWWYAAPRNGHISLYSKMSLANLASQFSLGYLSISNSTHIFFRGYSRYSVIAKIIVAKLRFKILSAAGKL